jgi:hypothetical protein
LFRAAACLSPNIACPSEVLGTPAVGSSADVMVQASWTAPASVSVGGTPVLATPYVRPAGTTALYPNPQFQQLSVGSMASLYPVASSAVVGLPQFSTTQWSMTQPLTPFGSSIASQGFVRAAPAPAVVQPQFLPVASQPTFGAPIFQPTTNVLSTFGPAPALQPAFSPGVLSTIRPATLQTTFNAGQTFQFAPALMSQPQAVRSAAPTPQPFFSSQFFQSAPNAQPVYTPVFGSALSPAFPATQPSRG